MKDIFRPIAAAAAAKTHLPDSSSIFRRPGRPQNSHGSEDDDGFVVSVPPAAWPPNEMVGALSTSTSESYPQQQQPGKLGVAAPLTPGTSSGESSSPLSSGRRGVRSLRGSRSPSKSPGKKPRTPSYYKIQLVEESDEGAGPKGMVQLTHGDDSSVQIAPDHNDGLQLAASTHSSTGRRQRRIIRAAPVVEQEGIEHEADEDVNHHLHMSSHHQHEESRRWTVSDGGQIIAVPPSPSRVPMVHAKSLANSSHGSCASQVAEGPVPVPVMPVQLSADPMEKAKDHDLSVPPTLVKANSSGSSSSDDSFVDSADLESPPRMNRSLITDSLFQDSLGSHSSGDPSLHHPLAPTTADRSKGSDLRSSSVHSKQSRTSKGTRSSSPHVGGGCGTSCRGEGLFAQLLDIFSLNGCCQQACAAR